MELLSSTSSLPYGGASQLHQQSRTFNITISTSSAAIFLTFSCKQAASGSEASFLYPNECCRGMKAQDASAPAEEAYPPTTMPPYRFRHVSILIEFVQHILCGIRRAPESHGLNSRLLLIRRWLPQATSRLHRTSPHPAYHTGHISIRKRSRYCQLTLSVSTTKRPVDPAI
ncbi:hypothetical protein HDV57DRAFT_168122 [Trichoderma longibrachiatum]|uniref:Uncharacterized protein n=1 Tax=Trichoderma longibrachiatum ATCC 18648 TaxID=983965 RepID=A0A2T4CA66_TRILO|nr:hypothetical protein M440DRAFT_261182 [Trichoderma longibrachiatum ATCC 18648]